MHTNWCVLIEISMEIGMLNFWLGILVTAQTKENYFNYCDNVTLFFMSLTFICYFFQITGLIVFMLLSWLFVSLIFMLVPVFLGRQIFALWFDENPRVYELYTSAMGLYTCLLLIRGATLFAGWLQQGWLQLSQKLREWAKIVSTYLTIFKNFLKAGWPLLFKDI